MTLSLTLQYLFLSLVVAASAWRVLQHLAPKQTTRGLLSLAAWLSQQQPQVLQRLGRRIRTKRDQKNCDSGCGACGGCSTDEAHAPLADPQPITFIARPRQ
jgi:hypothetical protein